MKLFSSERENAMLSVIMGDDTLVKKIGMICGIDFYPKPQPLFLTYDRPTLEGYSIKGVAFAKDGGGGEYVLLSDGTIGYSGQETECGRIAENFVELLELGLNCAYNWYNYSKTRLMNNLDLLHKEVMKYEPIGKQQFIDAYGDEIGDVDELRKDLARTLNLKISDDIDKDILTRYFITATREPLYFWENSETQNRSDDLVQKE